MGNKTPLYDEHVASNAKMVDFGGWEMPINYGSQIEEHHAVRKAAGVFDVSHMTIVDLKGDVRPFLRYLLANNIDKLQEPGKALYSCMLNEEGGVIDDLITYFISEDWFRLVVNAATRQKDLGWINSQAKDFSVSVTERDDLAMIAVQGPEAISKVVELCNDSSIQSLKRFSAKIDGEWMIARTGYTGEDGVEIMLPAADVVECWRKLVASGVRPIGLGARDTLRLEAGMNLYGTDMDEGVSPLESGLGWTVGWEPEDREFIGRETLARQRGNTANKLVGIVLEGKGVMRNHTKILTGDGDGEVTSGSFSPTLGKSIGFARVPKNAPESVEVELRGKPVSARLVKLPFVREGKILVE